MIIVVVAYILFCILAYTAWCADCDYLNEHDWGVIADHDFSVKSQRLYLLLSLLGPSSILAAVVSTNFFKYGFRWNIRPSSYFGGPKR